MGIFIGFKYMPRLIEKCQTRAKKVDDTIDGFVDKIAMWLKNIV
jgi:hypothetical protein